MTTKAIKGKPYTKDFLKLEDVLAMIPISRSTWFRGVRCGQYPPCVKVGKRSSVWTRESIDKTIRDIKADKIFTPEKHKVKNKSKAKKAKPR